MEHPVPQNVTSFEFHLIGDMTIRQFIYLASGLTIAYLTFLIVLPASPILAIPIIGLSAGLGAAFAFVPIYDRPLDHWVKAYFKAIYTPTSGVWKPVSKNAKTAKDDPAFANRLVTFLSQIIATTPPPAEQPVQIITKTVQIITKPARSLAEPTLSKTESAPSLTRFPIPQSSLTSQPTATVDKTTVIAQGPTIVNLPPAAPAPKIIPPQPPIQHISPAPVLLKITPTPLPPISLPTSSQTKPPIQALPQASPQPQTQVQPPQPYTRPGPVIPKPITNPTQLVNNFKTQPILTSFPNVINGIVIDEEGNYMEGVIVVIHNKEGLPVRALKTNKLGQFTGATLLPNGDYDITLEKAGLEFGSIQITLNDTVLPALQIMAKKGGLNV